MSEAATLPLEASASAAVSQGAPASRPVLSPITFAVTVLKKRLYKWQALIMASVFSGVPTAAVTPNGAGKTSVVISSLALSILHEFPGATVVVTSATFRAVRTQVFASLEQDKDKFAGWTWKDTEIEDAHKGRILGFATDSGAKFEGFHAYPGRPLLIIIDEAKTVADDIFVAADRCQPTMLLYISSPGASFGRFADAFKENSRFNKFEIGLKDCPHITPAFIEQMKDQYGEDSDIYQSMIEGKFAKGLDLGKVISLADYDRALRSPPPYQPGIRQAFCDFAESGDECAIATRDGNRLLIHDAWKPDGNVAAVAERFERSLRGLQERGYQIFGDADGTGHGYITTLKLRGINIRGVKNNSEPSDKHYFNLAAEQWWKFGKGVREGKWILPAEDELLRRECCTREQNFVMVDGKKRFGREDGILQLQPKRRSGQKSPNRADCIIGASHDYPSLAATDYLKGDKDTQFPDALPSQYAAMRELEEAERQAGFYAGE